MKSTGLNSSHSWLATIACTFISFLTMMPAKLSGLLFVEILERYNTDRAMASYPLLLCMLVRCSGGPLTGYCGERFGLYAVILAGCFISALGVSVCYVAQDIITVIIFLGLVYGLGQAFSITLFPQVLKKHFDKNLTLAISMSMFGACFGGFITPPLVKWIFLTYGVSGTFLIMGGIMLNGIPAAMLLKYMKPKKPAQIEQKNGKSLIAAVEELEVEILLKNAENEVQKSIEEKKEHDVHESQDIRGSKISDHIDSEKLSKSSASLNDECQTSLMLLKPHLKHNQLLKSEKDESEQTVAFLQKSNEPIRVNIINNVPPDKKPISKQKAALQSLSIFLDFTFLSMLFTQSAEVNVQILTLTTMLDYSRDKGIDRIYEVHFLMALPLAEVFGRVFLSLIIDRNYITKLNFTIISFMILAATLLIMVWAKSFAIMMVGVLTFGLVTSGLLSVFPMLIFEYMEPKNYIMAMASKAFLYGPMSFLCAPMIGYFRGSNGSYDWVYYIQAITSVVCGIITIFTPHLAKRRDKKNSRQLQK